MCNVEDLELPLGFEVKADAFGLNVAYLTDEEQASASVMEVRRDEIDEAHKNIYGSSNKLEMFNFTNVLINKTATNKFVLKNLSGINTSFKLNAMLFEPPAHVAPQQKTEIQLALEQEEARKKAEKAAALEAANQMGKKKNSQSKKVGFSETAKASNAGSTQ